MSTLLIIDGNAIVHRAFHAYPPQLTTPEGQPINAVYGWFAMLIKVIEEVKPTHIVATFDRPAPTFRKTLYAGYQANRPKMADGLGEQIGLLHEGLAAIGIPIYEIDGYEADDVIGTLAFQANQLSGFSSQLSASSSSVVSQSVSQTDKPTLPAGRQETGKLVSENRKLKTDTWDAVDVVILSGDRDLLQLVNEHTKVFMPIVGITKFNLFDPSAVKEKYGITPKQIIDYKALVGDASDGYPGVSGIGPKTASDLITTYGSFENLYEHISELPEKIATKLAVDAEQAALCKTLATIKLDAPVHLDMEKADIHNFTREKVIEVFDRFGFNSIKKRVGVFVEGEKSDKKQVTSDKKNPTSPKPARKKNEPSENQLELI